MAPSIRILILTYHYAPMNVIASHRPEGFAKHLYKFGIYPTILTHRWELNEENKYRYHNKRHRVIIEEYDKNKIIRIPRIKTFKGNFLRFFFKFSITRKLAILFSWSLGYLDTKPEHLDSYTNFKNFLYRHLKDHSYHMIIGIYSPHHHLKLCYNLNKRFKIKYALDFRDLWNNAVMVDNHKFTLNEKTKLYFDRYYWQKWLSRASFYTTISDLWVAKIGELTTKPGYKVMHGYDVFLGNENKSNQEFILFYAGSVNATQDLDMLGKAINKFIQVSKPEKLHIIFLGSKKSRQQIHGKFSYIENPSIILEKYINKKYFTVTGRVSREETFNNYKKASVLLLPVYKGVSGQLPGKLFEYLGTGKPIICFPDEGEVCDIIKKTKTGYVVNTSSQLTNCLNDLYIEWMKNGKVDLESDKDILPIYSRKFQGEVLSKIIKKKIL